MAKGTPVPLELDNNDGTDRKSSCAPLIPSTVFLSPGTQHPLSISPPCDQKVLVLPSTKTKTHCLIAAIPNIFNIKQQQSSIFKCFVSFLLKLEIHSLHLLFMLDENVTLKISTVAPSVFISNTNRKFPSERTQCLTIIQVTRGIQAPPCHAAAWHCYCSRGC